MTNPASTDPRAGRETATITAVRRYYQLVDAGDVAGLVDLFAPDASYHRPGYPRLAGRRQLERFYQEQRVIREGSHTLTKLVAAGRDVAVQGEFTGTQHDGTRIDARFADFFSFDPDGHFARRDTFFFTPLV